MRDDEKSISTPLKFWEKVISEEGLNLDVDLKMVLQFPLSKKEIQQVANRLKTSKIAKIDAISFRNAVIGQLGDNELIKRCAESTFVDDSPQNSEYMTMWRGGGGWVVLLEKE